MDLPQVGTSQRTEGKILLKATVAHAACYRCTAVSTYRLLLGMMPTASSSSRSHELRGRSENKSCDKSQHSA